jgi:hypothetical protein
MGRSSFQRSDFRHTAPANGLTHTHSINHLIHPGTHPKRFFRHPKNLNDSNDRFDKHPLLTEGAIERLLLLR